MIHYFSTYFLYYDTHLNTEFHIKLSEFSPHNYPLCKHAPQNYFIYVSQKNPTHIMMHKQGKFLKVSRTSMLFKSVSIELLEQTLCKKRKKHY